MELPRATHSWRVTAKEAMEIQSRLSGQVREEPLSETIRYIAGVDAAFSKEGRYCIAGAVLWDRESREPVQQEVSYCEVSFPYVPGLLSFREAPAVLAALERLTQAPDLMICDGQGIAHPRRFGIASHLGVICPWPTVGCGKSRLIGEHDPNLPAERGSWKWLWQGDEKLGVVLRTRSGVKPVFVSVGHKIDLRSGWEIVLECAYRYRLPEPTRLADRFVAQEKQRLNS